MFMISAVITLLGVISLSRLPVDLMPEFEQPTLNVRTSYAGVGPLEIEELITRPIEQAVSAVPGLTRVESCSSEGNSQVRLNFEWGSDLSEAADEVRTRVDRMRDRLPEDADPPTISSSTRTSCRSCRSASRATTTRSRSVRSPRTRSRRASSASTASPR